jgi:hypothetical protein
MGSWGDPTPGILPLPGGVKPAQTVTLVDCYTRVQGKLGGLDIALSELRRWHGVLSKRFFSQDVAKGLEIVINTLSHALGSNKYVYMGGPEVYEEGLSEAIQRVDRENRGKRGLIQQQLDEEMKARQKVEYDLNQSRLEYSSLQKQLEAVTEELRRAEKENSRLNEQIRKLQKEEAKLSDEKGKITNQLLEERENHKKWVKEYVRERDSNLQRDVEQKTAIERRNLQEEIDKEKRKNLAEQQKIEAQKSQLKTAEEEIAWKWRELEEATETFQAEKAVFSPGQLFREQVAECFMYLSCLRRAAGLVAATSDEETPNSQKTTALAVQTAQPNLWDHWSVQLGSLTLTYQYSRSVVAYAYSELTTHLDEIIGDMGDGRKLSFESLEGCAGVFGYSNFYRYLSQAQPKSPDGLLFRMLLDLSIPTSHIRLYAERQETIFKATAWLAGHLPPKMMMEQVPCYCSHSSELQNTTIAQTIIQYEQGKLFAFRDSLYIALLARAPFQSGKPSEEPDLLADMQLEEHQFEYLEHTSTRDGLHKLAFRYINPSLTDVPVEAALVFNRKGDVTIYPLEEPYD